MSLYFQFFIDVLENTIGPIEILMTILLPNLNSGTRQILTSLLAFVAYIAIKPASLPINLTKPIP